MSDELEQTGAINPEPGSPGSDAAAGPDTSGAGPTAAPPPEGGGAMPTPAAPRKRVRMRDVARETAQAITGTGSKAAPGSPAPGADAAAAAAAASKTPAPATPAATSNDPLAQLASAAGQLPEAARAPFEAAVGQVRDYVGQVQAYAAQVEELQAQTQADMQKINRVWEHPVFKAAYAAIARGQGGGNGQGSSGQGTNGQGPAELSLDQCETETERNLVLTNQQLRRDIQEARAEFAREIAELKAGHEDFQRDRETQLRSTFKTDMARYHAELDKQYPELAADPQKVKAWHKLASSLWADGSGSEGLRAALETAAKALHYDHAAKNGATNALRTARTAALQSTQPEGFAGGEGALPRKGERLSDFGKRAAVAAGLS